MPTVGRSLALALPLALLAACGGGGGGAPPAPPAVTVVLLQADLQGASEVPVVDASARATAFVEVSSDGTLSFAVTGQSSWVGDVTGLHVHAGAAGVNGSIVVDLLSDGATFDVPTRTVSDTFSIPAALAAQLAAAPASFYVNVHTTTAAAGLARGQLAPYVPAEWHAVLDDSEEVPANASGAHGAASLRVTAGRTLQWVAALTFPAPSAITMAHVHVGALGQVGSVFVDLDRPSAVVDAGAGTLSGAIPCPLAALARIAFAPDTFYVNLHTAGLPAGICRGQLDVGTVEMWAPLRGDRELVVVDAAARGGATLALESASAGRVIFAVPLSIGIGTITAAHVHAGAAGVNGGIEIDLMAGADFAVGVGSGSAEGSVAYSQAQLARLMANPAGFYVNLHTAAAPNGLVRGQLTQAPQSLVATLTGGAEIPPAAPGNSGRARVQLTGVLEASVQIDMTSPPAAAVTGAHVHDGDAATNGPILIDLLADAQTNGGTITGTTQFTGRTFARLLANPAAFYVNVHTAAEPGGAARGQLDLLSADSPPAGLVYSDPAPVYETGAPITPNVPDSIGGAVASYSVSPALPAGLVLNTGTGILSGTPTAVHAASDFVVTATNAAGSTQATVNITVNVGAVTSITYATPVVYVQDTQITDNVPSFTGGAPDDWQISPSLPTGLSIDAATGVISGTPTVSSAATDYTVSASNASTAVPVTTTVNIRVDATLQAPDGLSYGTDKTFKTGHAITSITPTSTGGPVDSYAISPSLPAGLSFNTSTGVISGTPTEKKTPTDYTITATNGAGNDQDVINIEVVLGEPFNLVYDSNVGIGYVSGGTFTTLSVASIEGGAELTYTISPALPPGLSINATTGQISGSPTQTSGQTTYTVTATNTAGNTTAQVTITVLQ